MQVGVGFWLTDMPLLRAKAEELAKAQYAVRKDPADAALMYMALGKKLLLQVCQVADLTSLPALVGAWEGMCVHGAVAIPACRCSTAS